MANPSVKLIIDDEVAADFRESLTDHYDIISHCVMELEKNPEGEEFLDEIFRSLHTIKGNANMCQFTELSQFTHSLENVISSLREGNILFTQVMGEVILLTLDKIKEVSEDYFADVELDLDYLDQIEDVLNHIETAEQGEIPKFAKELISLVTGHEVESETIAETISNNEPVLQASVDNASQNIEENYELSSVLKDGLSYFSHLASLLESKHAYWRGRIQRTLPLAQAINEAIGSPVNQYQLEAAVYMHDVAYAFINESLLLADTKYDDNDRQQMRSHPRIAANLMRLIPGWEEAVEIIYQHHERWDGSGYPKGLAGDKIGKGAQILSIVDAYESMTHPRPDRQYKRSVLRAVTEINNCSNSQFSPDITIVFNEIVRKMLASKKN